MIVLPFDVPSYIMGVVTGGVIVLISIMIRFAKVSKRAPSEIDSTYERMGQYVQNIIDYAHSLEEELKKLMDEIKQLKEDLALSLEELS